MNKAVKTYINILFIYIPKQMFLVLIDSMFGFVCQGAVDTNVMGVGLYITQFFAICYHRSTMYYIVRKLQTERQSSQSCDRKTKPRHTYTHTHKRSSTICNLKLYTIRHIQSPSALALMVYLSTKYYTIEFSQHHYHHQLTRTRDIDVWLC